MLWRRRKQSDGANAQSESVYARLQREQTVLWEGEPVTVGFDYQPYLKDPVRRRVNVRAVQETEMGALLLVGYCHDNQEERTFKVGSIHGDLLVEKLGRSAPASEFVESLVTGNLTCIRP